jgi:hypothetical protein
VIGRSCLLALAGSGRYLGWLIQPLGGQACPDWATHLSKERPDLSHRLPALLLTCAALLGIPASVGAISVAAASAASDPREGFNSAAEELAPVVTVWAAAGELGIAGMVVFGATIRHRAVKGASRLESRSGEPARRRSPQDAVRVVR